MGAFMAAPLAALALFQSAEAPSIQTSIQVFKVACLETAGDRGALQKLATSKQWRSVQAEAHPLMDWMDTYVVGSTALKLGHVPRWREGERFRPEQLICALEGIQASSDWPEAVANIEVEGAPLGELSQPPANYDIPPGQEMGVWYLSDGSRIHGTYVPSQRLLEMSINFPPEF